MKIFFDHIAGKLTNYDLIYSLILAKFDLDEYDYALDREKTGGDPPNKIYELCEFLLSIKSNGISGKFISAVWDPWIKKSFQEKLKKDENFATLRRIDGYNYSKV